MYVNTQSEYTPKTLSDFVFADKKAKKQIDAYVNGKQTKPIILYGNYGTGKSLLTKLIAKAIDGDNADFNEHSAIDLNMKEKIREMYLIDHQYQKLFKPANQKFKYIVIEELNFKSTKYSEFRLALDRTQGHYLTIMTTNEFDKIDDAVKSRSTMINIETVKPLLFLPYAKQIIQSKNCDIPDNKLLEALESVHGNYKGNRAYYELIDEILLAA